MTNFEVIAETPQTLAEFLGTLPVLEGPWDSLFQARYCAGCEEEECEGEGCLHREARCNPLWWLMQQKKDTMKTLYGGQIDKLRESAKRQEAVLGNSLLAAELRRAADAIEALLEELEKLE